METAGKCLSLNQIVVYSKCEQILSIKHVCSRSKSCQKAYFEQLLLGSKFDQTLNFGKLCLGQQMWSKPKSCTCLLRSSKCDQTLTFKHLCSDGKYKHSPSFKRVCLGSKMCITPYYSICLGIYRKQNGSRTFEPLRLRRQNVIKNLNIEQVCPVSK